VVGLEKAFRRQKGSHVAAVNDVSLEIEAGSMVTVLGPSGSGKTTLLRCIAGLEVPSGGEIWNGDRLLSSGAAGIIVPPEKRGFGMMFQSYAVWPHMTVFGNVAYPLQARRMSKPQIQERVTRMLDVVGIGRLRDEYPATLSGGQQQRVALARCLVNDPRVILFDEPLSNVDAKVREELRVELLAMHKRLGFAGVYVTHDQEEAMVISDRIVVMNEGKVVQIGTPQEVYRRPTSRFVANFIGVANMWEGSLKRDASDADMTTVMTSAGDIRVATANVPREISSDSDAVIVMARPEAFSIATERPGDTYGMNVWQGVLRAEMFRGSHTEFLVEAAGRMVRIRTNEHRAIPEGGTVFIVASGHQLRVLRDSEGSMIQSRPAVDDARQTSPWTDPSSSADRRLIAGQDIRHRTSRRGFVSRSAIQDGGGPK
jgi:iron(III) transport system ATP-binding protein